MYDLRSVGCTIQRLKSRNRERERLHRPRRPQATAFFLSFPSLNPSTTEPKEGCEGGGGGRETGKAALPLSLSYYQPLTGDGSGAGVPRADEPEEGRRRRRGRGRGRVSSWGSEVVPPGFRFHPTDEELVLYYLKRKVCRRRIRLPMIGDVDVYKWEPWELPERSLLRSGDKQWYFFSPRDRKYPNGSRSNRATKCGYWKTTGKDRTISQNSKAVGNKKTLVYYRGRAPKGERTDWVMYEYTLDDQMLMSCSNVQDSYALYKVFRKSGPGPKNGEQYGAPFVEKEWEDDSKEDTMPGHPQGGDSTSMLGEGSMLPMDDLEDLLLQISDEQDIIPQPSECSAFVSEIDVEAEDGSLPVVPSLGDANFTEQNLNWCELSSEEPDFQIARPDPAYILPTETPVTTSTNCSDQGQLKVDEEFLEIRDFNDPESTEWRVDDASNKDIIHETGGFYDAYDYFDATRFLDEEFVPLDGAGQNPYFDECQASFITTELWTHEQDFSTSTAGETNHIIMAPPASGIVNASAPSNVGKNTQGQFSSVRDDSDSWFSSALSALLDSVPSSPAIASENALISRAFQRVSSFRAGQIGTQEPNAATGGGTVASGRQRGSHSGGFLFISFLVGLVAVFWVLTIGAAVKVFKGLWGKFISS
ncbi:NAC domain-containing protein 17-like [Phoenix dactylifera]|uniref:NAC domain-containing protein 17-like n=1 Tax=Phoenix dactylifera TaxID=42345 RepID=A0A8B7CCX3_PHODC|nr:NAC domain-containing protein 17-like [Phoenix dactylifera]